LYLFLFYALLVAYISGSGSLSATFIQSIFSWNIPVYLGSMFFVILFGWVVYLGTRPVDLWNRVLMVGKILTFIALVALGVKHIDHKLLLRTDPTYAVFSLPILIISFG